MVDWVGLAIPFAYLAILIGSLATFSSFYRKRKATKAASAAPWFPPHLQKNIYLTLLHLEPDSSDGNKSPKVPDSVLKAALLRRATEDIHRIVHVRNAKPALQTLVQRGSVGDETWQRLLRAEQEIEEELKDVVNEVRAHPFRFYDLVARFADKGACTGKCIRPELGCHDLSNCKRDGQQRFTATEDC